MPCIDFITLSIKTWHKMLIHILVYWATATVYWIQIKFSLNKFINNNPINSDLDKCLTACPWISYIFSENTEPVQWPLMPGTNESLDNCSDGAVRGILQFTLARVNAEVFFGADRMWNVKLIIIV